MSTLHFFIKCMVLKLMKRKLKLFGWGHAKITEKLCQENDLDLEQKPLKILGATFSAYVCNVWEHSAGDITHKIYRMINAWSKGKLTLPGKIT